MGETHGPFRVKHILEEHNELRNSTRHSRLREATSKTVLSIIVVVDLDPARFRIRKFLQLQAVTIPIDEVFEISRPSTIFSTLYVGETI